MKKTYISIVIIGLLLFGGFGLVVVDHMGGHGGMCAFDVTGISNCTTILNPLKYVMFHLDALSRFFTAISINHISVVLSFLFFFAFLIFSLLPIIDVARSFSVKKRVTTSFVSIHTLQLAHWLALFENSPSFIGRLS